MAVYTCPKGHSSTENDYCSECGAKIDGGPPNAGPRNASPTSSGAPPGGQICPDCGVPYNPSTGIYCEVCGYNFKTGAHGELHISPPPMVAPAAPPVAAAAAPVPAPGITAPVVLPVAAPVTPPPAEAKLLGWEVTISVDPSLKVEGSPDAPTDFEPVMAALRNGSNLIGRGSPRRGIQPELSLDHDDAVSHRHALLEVHADGELTLRDIGSSNGTSVNGKEIAHLQDVKMNDGDQITLGHWTRLLVKAVQ